MISVCPTSQPEAANEFFIRTNVPLMVIHIILFQEMHIIKLSLSIAHKATTLRPE